MYYQIISAYTGADPVIQMQSSLKGQRELCLLFLPTDKH